MPSAALGVLGRVEYAGAAVRSDRDRQFRLSSEHVPHGGELVPYLIPTDARESRQRTGRRQVSCQWLRRRWQSPVWPSPDMGVSLILFGPCLAQRPCISPKAAPQCCPISSPMMNTDGSLFNSSSYASFMAWNRLFLSSRPPFRRTRLQVVLPAGIRAFRGKFHRLVRSRLSYPGRSRSPFIRKGARLDELVPEPGIGSFAIHSSDSSFFLYVCGSPSKWP